MIGPYRLVRVLGTGSFATVWLAVDDVLDRHVAVKILADNWSRDNDVRRRFLAEARVLLTVESPRIVRGFHIGESPNGQPYLVMAYADRGTLGDRIEQRRREGRLFDARETVGIATEVAYALADVHTSGHLHRDVKPTNVLIRSSSTRHNIAGLAADETVVLGDFGLARGLDLSALTMVAGSPGYVAPEQAAGLTQLDRRADLYPLGRMMLEMLTGDPGGRATTMAGAATEEVDVATLLAGVGDGSGTPSRPLVDLITRLVAKNPDDRPSSAEEVVAGLVGVAGAATAGGAFGKAPSGPPIAAPGPGDGGRPLTGAQLGASPSGPTGRRRGTWPIAAAAVLAAVVIVAVVVAITRRRRQRVGDDDGGDPRAGQLVGGGFIGAGHERRRRRPDHPAGLDRAGHERRRHRSDDPAGRPRRPPTQPAPRSRRRRVPPTPRRRAPCRQSLRWWRPGPPNLPCWCSPTAPSPLTR